MNREMRLQVCALSAKSAEAVGHEELFKRVHTAAEMGEADTIAAAHQAAIEARYYDTVERVRCAKALELTAAGLLAGEFSCEILVSISDFACAAVDAAWWRQVRATWHSGNSSSSPAIIERVRQNEILERAFGFRASAFAYGSHGRMRASKMIGDEC